MDTKQYYSYIALIAACALAVLWAIYSFLQHSRGNEKAKSNFVQGLIALAVFAVLAVILLPVYAGNRPPLLANQAMWNARYMAVALLIYSSDNNGHLPPTLDSQAAQNALLPYLKEKALKPTKNPSGPARFHLNPALAGKDIELLENKPDIPLIYDPNPFPNGTFLVAFTNGEARMISKEEWQRMKAKLAPETK